MTGKLADPPTSDAPASTATSAQRFRRKWKRWAGMGAAAVVLGVAAALWAASLLPWSYSVTNMGFHDHGGGEIHHLHAASQATGNDISALTVQTTRPADVSYTLTARQGTIILTDGRHVQGFTINGRSPGPTIEAQLGQLVEVKLVNENIASGTTLHWHGIDVPNAMDGVAGVTQDAVGVGTSFTYRFIADKVGTFWYHSHQDSTVQVPGGLLGAVVVRAPDSPAGADALTVVHQYGGVRTINGTASKIDVDAPAGQQMRIRLINSDEGPMPVWVPGASYRVLAVDGTEVNEPTPVRDKAIMVTAGGRVDLGVTSTDEAPVTIAMAGASIRVAPAGSSATGPDSGSAPREFVDLLSYGSPGPTRIDPANADRTFGYKVGRRFGVLDGRPGLHWTINGHMFPDVPMFMVNPGELVVFKISNTSGLIHPMHLHGHHATVLSRNGVPATGSPWVVDTLNISNGESYVVAFRADNPGIWMDHCHTLVHAAQGLSTHLMYNGYTTPFQIGGDAGNKPEGS